ncbi:MAG: TRAP transporter substrate-binding protein DctP [Magnetococcales bacterium]|nr:TRAP transporter substrate-binding protein DctP [Magnetococcales bacterium]
MRHLLLLLCILALFATPAHAEPAPASTPASAPATPGGDAIPMRLAAIHKGDVIYVQALTRLTRAIEESTGKQIRPELLANGKKGSEETALQEQFQGNLEGGIYSTLTLARQVPAFRTLATPLLFTRPEQLRAFIGSPLDLALRETAKSKNLLVLGYGSYGFYGILNFRPSGGTPNLNELTTRVPNDPWMLELHQAFGLRPTTLPAADLSDAITSARIQGVVATPELLNRTALANTNAAAFHQTRHLHGWMIFVVNLNWFNGQTPELQQAIQKAADTLLPQSVDQAMAQEQKILNKWSTEHHFAILPLTSKELATQPVKALVMKNIKEMEPLLNQPGAITQLWNQNQLPPTGTPKQPATKPRTTP